MGKVDGCWDLIDKDGEKGVRPGGLRLVEVEQDVGSRSGFRVSGFGSGVPDSGLETWSINTGRKGFVPGASAL